MVRLNKNWDLSFLLEIAPKFFISACFVDHEGYSISSKGLLPTLVDIMVIWIKFAIPIHFSSLLPKMSMLTLAVSLTTSNLPWSMDPAFLVPMQYRSLHHQTLLSLWYTTATGCCFRFCLAFLSLLELFLHSSPVVYWHLPTWEVHLSVSYLFLLFILFMGFSRQESFSSGPCFFRTFHPDLSILDGPTWHSSQFYWVRQS